MVRAMLSGSAPALASTHSALLAILWHRLFLISLKRWETEAWAHTIDIHLSPGPPVSRVWWHLALQTPQWPVFAGVSALPSVPHTAL